MNDERYAFYEDVRNRSLSTGKRASRWGRGVVMPSDLTKGKRREKASKVETRKYLGMYWNEFQKLAKNEQADLLRQWAKEYTPAEIAQSLGCKTVSLIPIIKYFKITYPTKGREEMPFKEQTVDITYEQFKALPDEERVVKYAKLTEQFKETELTRQWGLSKTVLSNLIFSTRNRIALKRERGLHVPRSPQTEGDGKPMQEKQTLSAEEVINLFTRIDSRIKELEADNERLKKIETAYNAIVNVLGNAMKGVGV